MTKLSNTQSLILSGAAQHDARIATAPRTLVAAARNAVFRSLLKNNLLTEINAPSEYADLAWRQDEEGTPVVLRITDEGMRAIGIDPNAVDQAELGGLTQREYEAEQEAAQRALDAGIDLTAAGAAERMEDLALLDHALAVPATKPRTGLRDAAQRVVDAWNDEANQRYDLADAIDALRDRLVGKPARTPRDAAAPRKPREGTKQQTVLTMLRRPEGATIAQIAEATGWAHHTVRGFFAGLKKKGHAVEVKSRERMVGANKSGAKGSFTIYALAE